MSDNKKDLTRIEDLGEYLHELNSEDESLPDLPSEDEAPAFESSFETSDFGSSEESTPFETSDFGSSEESTPFETSDFGSSEESTPFETSDFASSEESSPFETSNFGSSEESTTPFETDAFSTEEFTEETSPTFGIDSSLDEEDKKESETKTEPEIMPIPEPEPEPEPEPIAEPVADYTPSQDFKTPETFEDLKKFSESSSFTGMATEGNPSFSVLVKNIRYIEDINDIISLLKEFKLLVDSEEQTKSRLMRGTLLIPRVSEYSAIFLAHKLRRFDIDLQIGPSDEIHPPKHQETPETGIVSKHTLFQNQAHHFHFDDPKLEISQIIIAATQSLEGYQVVRYMGVASEHKMLESNVVEDENSSEIPSHYHELAQKLKAHALKNHSNAVVGLNYQLTPIPSEFGMGGHKYRLTCTGNLVWVNKL